MIRNLSLAVVTTLAALSAQTIETVGGTNFSSYACNRGRANLFEVTTSVSLIEFEVYLHVGGPETLTFFSYRHHSGSGTATLDWTHTVQVTGGAAPTWHSTGAISLPLVGGNHYTLGVWWQSAVGRFYNIVPPPSPVSFGAWQNGISINGPLPPTITIPGASNAQYHQRLTSVPFGGVTNVGASCGSGTPRLVASGPFATNTNESLELVDAVPGALGVISVALGPTLPTPVPLFGCSVWLDLNGPLSSIAVITSSTGHAARAFPVPNAPPLTGTRFSTQAGVLSSGVDITNAIDFTIV